MFDISNYNFGLDNSICCGMHIAWHNCIKNTGYSPQTVLEGKLMLSEVATEFPLNKAV